MRIAKIALWGSLATFATALSTARTIQDFRRTAESALSKRDVDPESLYPVRSLSVPVDHFQNKDEYAPHSNETFKLRYWFDGSYYKKGGPVIILAAGETGGEGRLPFLQKGILAQLAQATNGIGVVLEHRYYGDSFPTSDLSTENLRFLTTEQALADTAYFAKNVEFEGFGKLTAPQTPYIVYGGSYAGAFAAFLRVEYPDVFWGAISSSGVPEAIYDYWQYYGVIIRKYGPQDCVKTTQHLTHIVDNILLGNNTELIQSLKGVFGLGNLTYNDDFANLLSYGIGGWQGRNWDPEVNDPSFSFYCGNITSNSTIYPETLKLKSTVKSLVSAGGYDSSDEKLTTRLLNWIGYVNVTEVADCLARDETDSQMLDRCFSNHNSTLYALDDITQTWRSWPYQYCSQWGYFQTGSGVPANQLPLISRLIDLPYSSIVCREAFNITTPPDLQAINKYGGVNIEYPRLAFVDGEVDPWREAGPHATYARPRESTTSKPFILIEGAVHHWDENGRFPNETTPELPPKPVVDAQQAEREFVQAWLKEWNDHYH